MLLEAYSPDHVRSILRNLGVTIVSETYNDFLCLCPIHGNKNTPSFSVSHSKGVFLCFNPSCNASGDIIELVKTVSHRNDFEALRFIASMKEESTKGFEEELAAILDEKPEYADFDQNVLDRLHNDMNDQARTYLNNRGINNDSIDYFRLGYSVGQEMVIVPVHSPDGMPVGLVGRSIEGKRFKNSRGLPRNKTMFNLHRAKRESSTVIVCESSFDAIRIHQSGFPNVIATLGGFLSKENIAHLNRYFSQIIIMTDFDDKNDHRADNCRKCYPEKCNGHNPGRDLGQQIIKSLPSKNVLWASYEYGMVYPHNAKDVGELTEAEIRKCIVNAVPNYEYNNWNLY